MALYQYPASYGSQVRLRCKPIAKSLHIDEITTSHFANAPRNDNNCHLERSERSQSHAILRPLTRSRKKDTLTLTSSARAPQNDSVKLDCHVADAPRKDLYRHPELVSGSQTHPNLPLKREGTQKSISSPLEVEGKCAFTLAEVLITLGIIGVVAAITLPSIVHNVQKVVLKNQFKRAYSNLYNAVKYVQVQNGAPYACFIWDKNLYTALCSERNKYGSCIAWTLADGSPVPADINGKDTDCRKFTEDLMKTLKVVKFCENNALANGCITNDYKGVDKVLFEQNPDKEQDPNQEFSDSALKPKYPTFITADGVLYSKHYTMTSVPVFMIDINGHKGPNKWGYDIFTFFLKGDEVNGITKIYFIRYAKEKGGLDAQDILINK